MCPNAFYVNENEHRAVLYCSINGKNCIHSTLCLKKDKYIGANGMENCSIIGEIKQNYVYVKEIDGELVISLKPFKEEKEKRTYNRKKK